MTPGDAVLRAAVALAGYALAVAWLGAAPLARLTGRGTSPRLGLAAWMAAMGSALAAGGLFLFFLVEGVRSNWPHLTLAVCREVAGGACTPVIYRSALYEAGLAALLALASLAAVAAAWRYGRRVHRLSRQTLAHGQAARLVGRSLPGTGAVILEDRRPAAYCAAGTIVVTRGALDVLDDAQLAVVLAHERAHLSGRHHALCLLARGLTAAFPGVPLFARGAGAVARLAEMSADDAAARAASGRAVLVAALLAIATGTAVGCGPGGGVVPRRALAAAAYAVPARVERMLEVPGRLRVAGNMLALALVTLCLAAAPLAIAGLIS